MSDLLNFTLDQATSKDYDPIANGDIERWQALVVRVAVLADEEKELRKKIVTALFPDDPQDIKTLKGTKRKDIGDSKQLEVVKKLSYALDEAVWQTNKAQYALDGIPVDDLIKWSPDISLTVMGQLSDEQAKVFAPCVTVKPAMPSMKIVDKKTKE